jgi:hypothetical protein
MNQATEILPAAPLPESLPADGHVLVKTPSNLWLLVLISAVAAVLRLHAIAAKSFWLDEGISVQIARLPFEFYRSQQRPSPRWPEALVAANGADWAYRDSLFANVGEALQNAGTGGDRVSLILDLDRGADGKPNMESTILRAVFGKGRRLVDEKHISHITILLYARDSGSSATPVEGQPGKALPSSR